MEWSYMWFVLRHRRILWWHIQELWSPSRPCPGCGLRWFEGCTH